MLVRLAAFLACLLVSAAGASPSVQSGFVTTRGTQFFLNGKPFHYAGTNSYWAQFTTNVSDIKTTFQAAKGAGLQVIRTWGFNDINATFIQGGLPQYGSESNLPGAIVFQTWENGKATINTGATGLLHFDQLVKLAEQEDIKLIVALTNNWADLGGMDMYTINLGGQFHDEFYYNPRIVAAYKEYVKTIVSRYKSSPAIFAWELSNEPRCGADGTRNLPRSASGCNATVLTSWANEISTFIKSIDKNHLVTLGDEGFFNDASSTDPQYDGSDGVDFNANLRVRNLDFGTFHLYPDWWSKTVEWANQFILDHATSMRTAGKPVIMEEYGWMSVAARLQNFNTTSNFSRVEAEGGWQNIAVQQKLSGDMFWQFGLETGLSTGQSPDDGFTIFLENKTEANPLIFEHVAAMNSLNH